jgi:hypothetical protein
MAKIVSMVGVEVIPAASPPIQNACAGNRYERSPYPGAVGTLYATASVADTVTAELNVAGMSVTPANMVSDANRIPLVPDDVVVAGWEVFEGKLIQLTLVDLIAAGVTVYWRVDLQEAQVVGV